MTNLKLSSGDFLDELDKLSSVPEKITKIDEKLRKLQEDEDQDPSPEKKRERALFLSVRENLVRTLSSSSIPPPPTSSLHPPSPPSLPREIFRATSSSSISLPSTDFFTPPPTSSFPLPSTVPSSSQLASVPSSLDSFTIPHWLSSPPRLVSPSSQSPQPSSSSVPPPSMFSDLSLHLGPPSTATEDLSLRFGPPSSDLLPILDPPPSSSQPWLLPSPSLPLSQAQLEPIFRWTGILKRDFDIAVLTLGGPMMATPTAIQRLMGVKGLTIKQITSHLQRVRRAAAADQQEDAPNSGNRSRGDQDEEKGEPSSKRR